jgi:hypothetical protein
MSLLQALNLPVPVGLASAAAPKPAAPKPADAKSAGGGKTAVAAKSAKLLEAAAAWRRTHGEAQARVEALKTAVMAQCAESPPPLLQAIDKGLLGLDAVLKTVDTRLADALAGAGGAADDAAMKAELAKAKAIVTEYGSYMKGEPPLAHIDRNPFGTQPGLKALLADALAKAAKAIG